MNYQIITTKTYNKWFLKLKDKDMKFRITARLDMVKTDCYFGDYKFIKNGVYELRFHQKSGIRVYYTVKNNEIIILLAGGDKSTQKRDIEKAISIAKTLT
jgi:putative addiction module killer protein